MQMQYQAKREGTSWDECGYPWTTLTDNHLFSLVLDYRFRMVVEFVPGYYRDRSYGEVKWQSEEPNLRYWTRVKVLDAEEGIEYTAE